MWFTVGTLINESLCISTLQKGTYGAFNVPSMATSFRDSLQERYDSHRTLFPHE